MMSRWETMAANLPIIQQRLIALNELHQQGKRKNFLFLFKFVCFPIAFQFSSALSHYEAEQQALKTSLDANDQLLKQVIVNIKLLLLFIYFYLVKNNIWMKSSFT